jgi:hypothetical protein
MPNRPAISLFPFLSVLICTMGVLSFLAVAFLLMTSGSRTRPAPPEQPVEVRWVGAPDHVRPLLVECRGEGALVHGATDMPARLFSIQALEKEIAVVRELQERGLQGRELGRQTLWFFFKSTIEQERRLQDSFTLVMHRMEISNLTGENRRRREERYPIFLVYPDGIDTFDLVSYLVEATTRLSTGTEPMLPGWKVPRALRAS